MPQGSRPDRVGDQIRVELGDLLARHVRDPGLGFVTITHVQTTRDLQIARVYYTSLGDASNRRDTARALRRAAPFLRRQIGKRLRLRRVPEIEFRFDESIERQNRIEQLLRDLQDDETSSPEDERTTEAIDTTGGRRPPRDPRQE